MQVITRPEEFDVTDLYVDLRHVVDRRVLMKCEGFNFARSSKLKPALEMVTLAERAGVLRPGSTIVETSSGNLGVALSLVAASRGYRFVCVTDPRSTLLTRQLMQNLGTEVLVAPDPAAGLRLVRRLCAENDGYTWLDQYVNAGNWMAHFRSTGPDILRTVPELDVLFVGVGSAGTLTGCARYLRQVRPQVRIVAVECVGPGPRAARRSTALRTSVRFPVIDMSLVDDLVRVDEAAAIRECRRLAQRGFLLGGGSGMVLAGALGWLEENDAGGAEPTAVVISPDLGDRYLDTIYQDQWVKDNYGPEALLDGAEPESRYAKTLFEVP
ncbi:pyridoxal-phosphate dependent enzyme [Amycolatopsis sp. DG1A-15b]|uniref:pyridoxal-phosphate dependent enzyme n=1 Tax=Amycolatopsis sp. DG1A-15b TaxID=3052846 RepID=UPI00255BF6B1|nr:pyridoxal-phosphate dependent enzyme [Amycolatopsis sp. DG1A-15b]WIX90620.1 pyridoxal-phosphate dependent enzyme [Amycolatopsis sp. DG1A-15b]